MLSEPGKKSVRTSITQVDDEISFRTRELDRDGESCYDRPPQWTQHPEAESRGGTGPSGIEGGDSIADFQLPMEVQRELADLVKNVVSKELQKLRVPTQDAPGGSQSPSDGPIGADRPPQSLFFRLDGVSGHMKPRSSVNVKGNGTFRNGLLGSRFSPSYSGLGRAPGDHMQFDGPLQILQYII